MWIECCKIECYDGVSRLSTNATEGYEMAARGEA